MKNESSIGDSLIGTIASTELTSITIDLAEVAIDAFIKEGVLKDIPIIGSIIGLYKSSTAVRDHIFLKKIVLFLSSIKDVPTNLREDMFLKLEADGHDRHSIGENLILVLDKADHYNKANILGLLLKALSMSKIDYHDFERFCSITVNVFIQDLLELPQFLKEKKTNMGSSLEAHGLLMRKSLWVDEYAEYATYSLSPVGRRFCSALELIR